MDYWTECIKESFSEAEIIATDEQIKTVIEWVEGAHENIGMATGSEHIPNPLNAEVDALERKIKTLQAEHERQISGVLKGVAHRRNVDLTNVNIDTDGLITYR
tara:strand:+ start:2298 stop:2606 length:309 start_codon:yes stop_codon:yes gene_type:complete